MPDTCLLSLSGKTNPIGIVAVLAEKGMQDWMACK